MSHNVSTKRQQDIALLILQTTQTPTEQWINLFKSRDEVEYALDANTGCLSRLPTDQRGVAVKRLELAIERYKGNTSVDVNGDNGETFKPDNTLSTIILPSDATTNKKVMDYSIVMPILETDKGSFHHMDTWKGKLSEALKHMEGFDQIFSMACLIANIDPTIDYISESKKRLINSKLSECSALYIEQLTSTL